MLHFLDVAILFSYLAVVVGIGLWMGRGQKNLNDYLLGGRDLPWWALLGSIVATETSTATFLSVPAITFANEGDLTFLQLAFGVIIGRLLIVLFLLPHYFRGEIYTAYELLDQRFGGATKPVAGLMFLVARNVGDGLRLYLAGVVLEKVTLWPVAVCIAVIAATTIGYTVVGGMKSVVWNDCLQFVLYTLGGVVMAVVITRGLDGGWRDVIEFGRESGRFHLLDWHVGLGAGYTVISGVIGGMFLSLGTHGVDQMMVQRYLSARTQRDASLAVSFSGFVVFGQFAMFLLIGVALATFYAAHPADAPSSHHDVVATFLVHELPVGFVGLLLAAIFAAAMSTLSSSLNSSATSTINDLYLAMRPAMKESPLLVRMSKLFTVFYGVLQAVLAIAVAWAVSNKLLEGTVVENALQIAGFVFGVLLGVFALGMFSRRAGPHAALLAIIVGIGVETYIKFGTDIFWPWLAVFGSIATFVTGWLASFVVYERPKFLRK